MSSSLLNVITYYQRSIEKNGHDEKRLLHCIEKLYKLPVSLEHLQSTGVGKTVNSLRKFDKEVGVAAKALVAKWKAMVAAEAQVVEEDEDEDTQSEPHDDDPNGNSQENTNTHSNSRNNCLNDVNDNRRSHSHHAQHRDESPSSSSKEKRQNVPEMCNKSKLQGNRSHSSHNSSRYKSDAYKSCKLNSGSSKKEDQKKRRRDEHSHSKPKESDSDSQTEEKSVSKLSIVEEIEHDFEVLADDDDEEKLIIDVSKEKTEEIERKSKSEPRHHSSKDNAKKESSRSKENSRKENSYSKEKHSKESRRHEDSRKDSSSSKESTRKESSGTKESSHREHNSRRGSYSNENLRKDRHHREKDREKSERKDGKCRGKSEESHKSRHSEPRDKESKRKDEEQQSSSSHTSNGEHHKSKHKDKDKDKNQERDSREKSKELKRRNNSDSESKSTESSPTKAKIPKILVDGIDSSMGTSFEDALGMISASSSTKKALKTSPKVIATSSVASSHGIFAKPSSRSPIRSKTPPLLTTAVKLEPLDPNITLDLPTISPNYKPLPLNPIVMECVFSTNKPPQKPQRLFNDEEAMSAGISSKTIRTKVYSGAKLGAVYQVQSLFDLCIRVLQKNIDGLEYTGGVPFDVLKPVLERATPQQLVTFEEYNPYLMEDSDILWQQHCIRYYRGHKRLEMETWREMFFRCKEEQDRKLNMLAENIKQSQMQIQLPVRKTQLAYVDSMVKPPRNVIRKQEQYGTKSNLIATPAARVAALCNITPNASKAGDFRLKAAASSPDTLQIATANNGRPKKAPLMQKTIKFMKGRFKR